MHMSKTTLFLTWRIWKKMNHANIMIRLDRLNHYPAGFQGSAQVVKKLKNRNQWEKAGFPNYMKN